MELEVEQALRTQEEASLSGEFGSVPVIGARLWPDKRAQLPSTFAIETL